MHDLTGFQRDDSVATDGRGGPTGLGVGCDGAGGRAGRDERGRERDGRN